MIDSALRPILCIEDSDEDFYSLRLAFEDLSVQNPIERCANGKIARAMLDTDAGWAKARETAVILLDLNMPGLDGRELLTLFRQRESNVPVVILSTSSHPGDIAFCHEAGADDYMVKPLEFDRWRDMLRDFAQKWLHNTPLAQSGEA